MSPRVYGFLPYPPQPYPFSLIPYPFTLVTTLPLAQKGSFSSLPRQGVGPLRAPLSPGCSTRLWPLCRALHQHCRSCQTRERGSQHSTPCLAKTGSNLVEKFLLFVVPPRVRFSPLSTSTLSFIPYTLSLFALSLHSPWLKKVIFMFPCENRVELGRKVAFFVVLPRARFSPLSSSTLSFIPYTLSLFPCHYTPPQFEIIRFHT